MPISKIALLILFPFSICLALGHMATVPTFYLDAEPASLKARAPMTPVAFLPAIAEVSAPSVCYLMTQSRTGPVAPVVVVRGGEKEDFQIFKQELLGLDASFGVHWTPAAYSPCSDVLLQNITGSAGT